MQQLCSKDTSVAFSKKKPTDLSQLLNMWQGQDTALNNLIESTYERLCTMAHRLLFQERHTTLQTSGLVHEVFLRLINLHSIQWRDANHFFSVCCGMMRRILVDHARSMNASKRGGEAVKITLNDDIPDKTQIDVLDLNDALDKLNKMDQIQFQIVELRYFSGMTISEIAPVLKLSPATIKRKWSIAQAWLYRELSHHG